MASPLLAQLTAVQNATAALLSDTAQVRRFTTTNDGEGGYRRDFADVGGQVACLVVPWVTARSGGTEAELHNRFEEGTRYRVYVPAGTDVTAKDQIVINDTRTLEVELVTNRGTTEVVREVVAIERPSG